MHDLRATMHRRRPERAFMRHPPLIVGALAAVDAALFTAIGALHLGVSLGSMSAPRTHWTAPIELFGAACCAIGAAAVWTRTPLAREIMWLVNGLALWCILLGVFAYSAGLDPCTPITNIHYLVTAAVTFTSIWRMGRWQRGLSWPP